MFKRAISLAAALCVALSLPGAGFAAESGERAYYEDILDVYTIDGTPAFRDYAAGYPAVYPGGRVEIGAADYTAYSEGGETAQAPAFDGYEGNPGVSVLIAEDADVTYTFEVPEEGFRQIALEYYPVPGKSGEIQRSIFFDGELPCREFALSEFSRVWTNSVFAENGVTSEWKKDNQGNDLKPSMVEIPRWIYKQVRDTDGYVPEPLAVYLTAGTHEITIHSLREPVILRRIVLENTAPVPDYDTYLSRNPASDTSGVNVTIEGESAARVSSQMLYPTQNGGSPALSPSSPKELLNNTIGGGSWRLTGQWLEWDFEVPATGYYNIGGYFNQNFKRGIYVSRKITIDGEVPFSELNDYGFTYALDWHLQTLSDASGEPYKIYLAAGRHTLRMEAVLGGFADIISEVRDAVYDLNAVYRQVIRLTGTAPDRYRDYQIERSLPGLTADMRAVRDSLAWTIDELTRVAGRRSDRERVLVTMRDQLTNLIEDNERFGKQISSFKVNVRACGTWLNEAMSQPLQIDRLYVHSADVKIKVTGGNFFNKLGYEIARLFYSFVINYNAIGNVDGSAGSDTITLWIGSGRDQANVIKSLIDETFTPVTGVGINVMLVDMSTLLQATLAGQGPDVAIQVAWDLPMNYGLRDAVTDLTRFPDLSEVKKRFAASAMTPYEYNGATYALPETQVFPMMFYRKDILAELGIEIPETWEDVNVLMAVLAHNQMELGMLPGESVFTTLLYQNGGRYYNDGATKSALDEENAINAFKKYTEFYTDYKLDRNTSAEERFRTGECPIIVADYTLYNNLQVSAPDLRGIWGMAPVPGTRQADGSIDRSVGSYGGQVVGGAGTGGACVVMEASDSPEACWEFLKWWTSAQTQTAYGREMESLMGSSARVPTANTEAFTSMPWPVGDLRSLQEQFKWARGIPQVPGGYFTFRNVNNAFYSVTTPESDRVSGESAETPREALTDKILLINDEIRYKRVEFGLPLE